MKINEFIFEDTVDEALVSQQNIGDQLEGPFNPRNLRLINNPAAREKAAQYFRNSQFNFRVFFCHYPHNEGIFVNGESYSRRSYLPKAGKLSQETIKEFFNKNNDASEIINGSPNNITLIVWPKVASEKASGFHPLTPHIIAHYFGHAMRERELVTYTIEQLSNALMNIYGIKVGTSGQAALILANKLGTTKSGREGKLSTPYELSHEALAQYINKGMVIFNPLPENIVLENKTYTANIDDIKRQQWSKQLSYYLTSEHEKFFKSIIGTVWIMAE